jgi:phosphoglycerate dehydrogenase-like enzyme
VLYPVFGGSGVIDQLDDLGVSWVQLPGTGVDAFRPLDRFAGVTLTCARGTSATAISEFVLASMLLFEKRLTDVWLHEAPPRWNIPESTLGTLYGRTLGLVGLGGIGSAIATRALPFGMRVVAFRRHADQPSPVPGVDVVGTLDELLPVADHLVVAAPATSATAHLLDASAFEKVKAGVHLVNIARGTLVDQDALRAALDDGRVACASLDVADPEPVPAGHWLYEHPNVRLTAHISWSMPGGFENISGYFLDNLDRWLRGDPLEGVVDITEGY